MIRSSRTALCATSTAATGRAPIMVKARCCQRAPEINNIVKVSSKSRVAVPQSCSQKINPAGTAPSSKGQRKPGFHITAFHWFSRHR